MKLISLNVLGGKYFAELTQFIDQHLDTTDIFCFQEVFDNPENIEFIHGYKDNLWQNLSNIFIDFHRFYSPVARGIDSEGKIDDSVTFGLGVFINNKYKIDEDGDLFTYRERFGPVAKGNIDQPECLQYVSFKNDGKKYIVCNFHGKWYPGDKLDNSDRINQSKKIIDFLNTRGEKKILCGDFNLLPETESVKMLEREFRNLIKEFNVETTRGKLSPYYGKPDEQKYADYIFVSKDVKVKSFKVPDVEVSDHLPMILEFED